MQRPNAHPRHAQGCQKKRRDTKGLTRRDLLKAGLGAGVISAWPLSTPSPLWGGEAGPPKRGGILRVRGGDPPHFDPHLTICVLELHHSHGLLAAVCEELCAQSRLRRGQPRGRPVA